MSEQESELFHAIQIPLEYSFKTLIKGKSLRFIRKGIWLMLVSAALLGFAASILEIAVDWRDIIRIIFISYGCLILLSFLVICLSASIQARQMKMQRLFLQIFEGGISLIYINTGEKKELTWEQVITTIGKDAEWVFQVPFLPHFIFVETSRLSDEENEKIKKWTGWGGNRQTKAFPD